MSENKEGFSLTGEIESELGMHDELSIIYVVDGYSAMLYKGDDCVLIAEGEGPTITQTVSNLEENLKKLSTKEDMTTKEDKNKA